ncbi:DUF2326 domain-containing protein [Sphingobium yanoikuyae]|jgi:uncharacterized protein YydD (DUF2326 family)|uniref:DUF2326 domain-containing protein n=3 Tax=Alphaproteobacteria TaxID=28211 RepID=A0A5P2QV53_9RHOB|nr:MULTISPECIES: DUF2326 domain-containing protein [Alphaproteobacteria]MDH2133532.1 DUF2326 domain-containing protein [Sphingobium yanoikuyae]MDH2152691.1 DUF2326 domain-containing protein [Sphingobium yanoikuyae]MDH2168887.1 DUF2326 domain-containing protein [Sphingobium yanoikuyae]QEU09246.1 DUF2326 domain-containing protein [Paracoccus yeei]URI15357.1 DUF2326 domain-containing protein [Brevundimonas albigilva]
MIRAVRANQKGFHTAFLQPGVNLILADRSTSAGDKDTTNALGKSTLIEIIDFCLASNTSPGKGLRIEALQGWAFTLELSLSGRDVAVTRATDTPGFFAIEGATDDWPVRPTPNKEGVPGLDAKKWRAVLAWALFGISDLSAESGYKPSARSLLSYFVRNQTAAYNIPFKHFDNQKTWDIQVHNAFLLGLNWEKAATWQQLKDQKNALDALKQAIKTGAVDGELASLGELEAERLRLSTQLEREREALSNFRVLPQYREIETQANLLTSEIHGLVNANIVDKRRLDRYRDSLVSEDAPTEDRLEALYGEAGIALPGAVKKTLADARAFNAQIIANRREFIAGEIAALEAAVSERETDIANLTDRRANYLSALAGQGALEELTQLQELHAATRLKVDELTNRITQLRQMTTKADTIKVETVELKRATTLDYEERRALWSRALSLFSEFSESLYKSPGRLVIDIDDTGYKFDVEIAGSPSEGISKMKIFCYDLMLISFARQRGLGIDFLIHDSTIFDGVDPRQRAHALELAAAMAAKHGFQYICTLNTDMVPVGDFTSGFDYESLVRLRLTDTDPTGSLLGFRY